MQRYIEHFPSIMNTTASQMRQRDRLHLKLFFYRIKGLYTIMYVSAVNVHGPKGKINIVNIYDIDRK